MDYDTRMAEIRAHNAEWAVRDKARVRDIERLQYRARGSLSRTSSGLLSMPPTAMLAGGGTLGYLAYQFPYYAGLVTGSFLVLLFGIALPAMAWMYLIGIYRWMERNFGFGLGYVVYGMVPCSFGAFALMRFIPWNTTFLARNWHTVSQAGDPFQTMAWVFVRAVIPPLLVLNFVAGVVAAVWLIVRAIRRHRADTETIAGHPAAVPE